MNGTILPATSDFAEHNSEVALVGGLVSDGDRQRSLSSLLQAHEGRLDLLLDGRCLQAVTWGIRMMRRVERSDEVAVVDFRLHRGVPDNALDVLAAWLPTHL